MKARPQREAIESTIERLGDTGGGRALTACLAVLDVIEREAWSLDPSNKAAMVEAVKEALGMHNPIPEAISTARREALAKATAAREATRDQR